MNKVVEAMEFLEGYREGYFGEVVEFCLERGGVVHAEPGCFLAGVPVEGEPGVLYVVFQCSRLDVLRRVLCGLSYERVRWSRDLRERGGYGVRERAVADFCRHENFGLKKYRS